MPEPLRCHRIPLPTWRALVIVIVGGSADEIAEVFRCAKLAPAEVADLSTYCSTQMRHTAAVTLQAASRPRRQFIYFAKKPDLSKPENLGTLAHELLHVVFHLMRASGMRLNEGSEEAYCYLHAQLVDAVVRTDVTLVLPSPTAATGGTR